MVPRNIIARVIFGLLFRDSFFGVLPSPPRKFRVISSAREKLWRPYSGILKQFCCVTSATVKPKIVGERCPFSFPPSLPPIPSLPFPPPLPFGPLPLPSLVKSCSVCDHLEHGNRSLLRNLIGKVHILHRQKRDEESLAAGCCFIGNGIHVISSAAAVRNSGFELFSRSSYSPDLTPSTE